MLLDAFVQVTPGSRSSRRPSSRPWASSRDGEERGGLEIAVTARQLYATNLWLRTANRVLVRRAMIPARNFAQLERRATDLAWDDWLAPGPVRWRVSSSRSALYHTGAVAERLARITGREPAPAIRRRFDDAAGSTGDPKVGSGDAEVGSVGYPGTDPGDHGGDHQADDAGEDAGDGSDGAPGAQVVVAASSTTTSRSASTARARRCGGGAGAGRGPRRRCGRRWPRRWCWPAAGTPPRARRWGTPCAVPARSRSRRRCGPSIGPRVQGDAFAFQRWPSFEPGTWASVTGEARRRARPSAAAPPIVAADRDAGAVEVAGANAEAAGVGDVVEVRRAPLARLRRRHPPAGS